MWGGKGQEEEELEISGVQRSLAASADWTFPDGPFRPQISELQEPQDLWTWDDVKGDIDSIKII